MTDKIEAPAAPLPGTPEYTAAMVAKAGNSTHISGEPAPATTQAPAVPPTASTPPPAAAAATKPEWCPDKFWDATKGEVNSEALGKSYGELERKHSTPPAPATPQSLQVPVTPPAPGTDGAAPVAPPKLKDVMRSAAEEFGTAGKLGDATYAAFETHGMDRDAVDQFVEGQSARATLYMNNVRGAAGGDGEYGKVVEWAKANQTAQQIEVFNRAVTGGDEVAAVAAVQTLTALYKQANGAAPAGRLEASAPSAALPSAYFKSAAEMTAAMADPRYKRDPAFRGEVAAKIEGSMKLNINLV